MMKSLTLLFVVLAVLCSAANSQIADEIVAKHNAARGGLKKFHAIKTMTVTGRLAGPGMDAPIKVIMKGPNKFHMDLMIEGKTLTRVFDGTSGWQIQPSSTVAEPLTGGELLN